jgi:hypothetical protein
VRSNPTNATAVAALLAAAATTTSPALAGSFDAQGRFSFEPGAAVAESFETWQPPADAGASKLVVVSSATSLHGAKVLQATLASSGVPVPLDLPKSKGAYRLGFWMQGDCVGGAAVDYDAGGVGTLAQAFPTGRVTSDGWVEMRTERFMVDGTAPGLDARLYLRAYDASVPLTVQIDALEVIEDGAYGVPVACIGTDEDGACGESELCLGGTCHNARGWVPPLPGAADRDRFVDLWKQKIHDTFGPYEPRKASMPDALATIEKARQATTALAFWSRFAETIRRLRDAHTYTRSPFQVSVGDPRPLNACFFEGDADLSHAAWPSDPAYPDILVSHVGPDHAWGLHAGDRLVAVDGLHPIAWAKQLLARSFAFWEADDATQFAHILYSLRGYITRHARSVSVVRCDAAAKSCASSPETVLVSSVAPLAPGEAVKLVGCDNRPFAHLAGTPVDHRYGMGLDDDPTVIEGLLLESSSAEAIHGLAWNSLLGWQGSPLDSKLRAAVAAWQSARGVVQDHREGHGGTSEMANILVSFSRTPFVPLVSLMRTRADDEGPATAAEGKQIFVEAKPYAGQVAGSSSARTDVPVALVLTWDVSASDILAYMMKGGPKVKLFSPGPTMGAFGTFFQYSYWGGLLWSIGAEDSISPDGITLSGHGVAPDVKVLPRQSDLLAGKDTVHDAALAWVRKELVP